MIATVQARQQGAFDFENHYDNLCALQDTVPLPSVKAHLHDNVLDLNGDRIRANDWIPIINSLKINKTLEFVAIRSYIQQPDENGKINGQSALWKKKTPSVRSKEITFRICKSLHQCLINNKALACIEIQGLPLRTKDLVTLTKGITKNSTLNHLSLENCGICDSGLDIVCKGLKNSFNINSINVTGCNLTSKGGELLSNIVKHQAMKRHTEAWSDSLRYRRPDLDQMSGIRRITVNFNPLFSDKGAIAFAEALKDDLWLKALDMQYCGIGNTGAQALLDVLKYNTTIVVLDVRANPLIDRDKMQRIMEQVMINCNGQDTEYKWIRTDIGKDSRRPRMYKKKKTILLNNNLGRKTTIKVSPHDPRLKQPVAHSSPVVSPERGLPWRTALRASRYKGHAPEHNIAKESIFETSDTAIVAETSIHVDNDDTPTETLTEMTDIPVDTTLNVEYRHLRDLKLELEQLRRKCKEETKARSNAEERVLELTVENSRLKNEVAELERTKKSSFLDDEKVLETIESSFRQFHSFLDILREAGLGHIITLAGLEQDNLPFGNNDESDVHVPPRSHFSDEERAYVLEEIETSLLMQYGGQKNDNGGHGDVALYESDIQQPYPHSRDGQGDIPAVNHVSQPPRKKVSLNGSHSDTSS